MALSPRKQFRRQVRGFVFLWTGISIIVATATFIAIYMSYPTLTGAGGSPLRNVALPSPEDRPTSQPTLAPTLAVVATDEVAATPDAEVASAASEGNPPRANPMQLRRFQLGTQVQVSYDRMGEWMNVAANQLDVGWVKMQVRWENMEAEEDNYDWFETDTFLPAARDQNLFVLLSIVTTPEWAREEGANPSRHGPPADNADYVEFVRELIERYPGLIAAIEVWNEQNLDREWTSAEGLSAANYVALLGDTYAAVKALDPNIIVVSGALSPTGVSDGVTAIDDFIYLDQMIEAGLVNVMDCLGVHHNGINVSPAYTWDAIPEDDTAAYRGPWNTPHHSWSFRSTLETYASKVAVAGGPQRLCVTEFGWPSADGLSGVPEGLEFSYDNTLEEQRDYTVQALDFMQESGDVWLAFLWNLNYGAQAGWAADNENVPYSVIGPEFVFRPVFDAARDWNRAYEAAQ